MPTDHPDGTRSIVISRADIQMPIDVQHQTVNVKTNFKEQEVGVIPEADWQVKAGNQKFLVGAVAELASGAWAMIIDYTVTAGKVLYLYGASCASRKVNSDLNHACEIAVQIGATEYLYAGGNAGVVYPFTSPIKVTAGVAVRLNVYNNADHTCSIRGSYLGFEKAV